MRTPNGLSLDRWVPPGVEDEYVIGGRQVESRTTGLQADEEHLALGVRLEALDWCLAVFRLTVEVLVGDAFGIQRGLDDR